MLIFLSVFWSLYFCLASYKLTWLKPYCTPCCTPSFRPSASMLAYLHISNLRWVTCLLPSACPQDNLSVPPFSPICLSFCPVFQPFYFFTFWLILHTKWLQTFFLIWLQPWHIIWIPACFLTVRMHICLIDYSDVLYSLLHFCLQYFLGCIYLYIQQIRHKHRPIPPSLSAYLPPRIPDEAYGI
jgi:hypothetical protein